MPGLDYNFEIFSSFGWRVAFAWFEYFNVPSLHLLPTYFYGAERNQDSIAAGRRSRARRRIPGHSNEFVFQQGACLKGLQIKQRYK